jgi:hypothetical protein
MPNDRNNHCTDDIVEERSEFQRFSYVFKWKDVCVINVLWQKKRYCEKNWQWKIKILTIKESGVIGDGLWGQNVGIIILLLKLIDQFLFETSDRW